MGRVALVLSSLSLAIAAGACGASDDATGSGASPAASATTTATGASSTSSSATSASASVGASSSGAFDPCSANTDPDNAGFPVIDITDATLPPELVATTDASNHRVYRLDAKAPVVWHAAHYVLHGGLEIPAGAQLTLSCATLELAGPLVRTANLYIAPQGQLITDKATVGGTKDAMGNIVQTSGSVCGQWSATDTTIRYSYGISMKAPANEVDCSGGVLWATRLARGENPDSIILVDSIAANVKLTDSDFAVSLLTDVRTGGPFPFDLPNGKVPIQHKVYDQSSLPTAKYSLELTNTSVPYWFVFFFVTAGGPPVQASLDGSDLIIPSFLASGANLGLLDLHASRAWDAASQETKGTGALPAHTKTTIGNFTLELLRPMINAGFSLYLTNSSASVRAGSTLAELLLDGSSLDVAGSPGTFDTRLEAVSIDLQNGSRLSVSNAELGVSPSDMLQGVQGFVNVAGASTFFADHVKTYKLGVNRATPLDTLWFLSSIQGAGGPVVSSNPNAGPFDTLSFIGSAVPSTKARHDALWMGARIKLGASDKTLAGLGRYHAVGNASAHTLRVLPLGGGASLADVPVNAATSARDALGFDVALSATTPVLKANQEYCVLSQEDGSDAWGDLDAFVTTTGGYDVVGPAYSTDGTSCTSSVDAGHTYGPVAAIFYDDGLLK